MIEQFQALSQEEQNSLFDAIPLITVLIAGADGIIDREERKWASKMAKIRTFSTTDDLHPYYNKVSADLNTKVDALIAELPGDVEKRNNIISERLAALNIVLPKIDQVYAAKLYAGMTSFAEHVAKASGGWLRIGAISAAEKKYINLPMLNVVHMPEIEEEE